MKQTKRNKRRRDRIAANLARGMAFHQQGNTNEADRCYRQILEWAPRHPDALHLSGLIADQRGDRQKAVELITRATREDPAAADYFSNLGAVLKKAGNLEEASRALREATRLAPGNAAAVFNLGSVLLSLQQYAEAKHHIEKALVLRPGFAEAHNSLGNLFLRQEDLESARTHFDLAIAANSAYPSPHNNLGILFQRQGDALAAVAALNRALALKPDYVEAYNNLVAAYRSAGLYENALRAAHAALALQASSATTWQNLGAVYRDLNKPAESLDAHRRSAQLAPDNPTCHFNLAERLKEVGRPDLALGLFQTAIRLAPDSPVFQQGLARCLAQIRLPSVNPELHDQLLLCLENRSIYPGGAIKAVAVHMKQAIAAQGPEAAGCLTTQAVRSILADPLISRALETGIFADPEAETFLTAARNRFLQDVLRGPDADLDYETWIPAVCALAQQCFLNEYVYSQTKTEEVLLDRVRRRLAEEQNASGDYPQLLLVVLAAYQPLKEMMDVGSAFRLSESTTLPSLRRLIRRQVLEVEEEKEIGAGIRTITPVRDATSIGVRAQYEQNPYPRWQRVAYHEPMPLHTVLRAIFPAQPVKDLEATPAPTILIAGCGTGNQALESAGRISNASFLAMDLSRASLAYAVRRAKRAGVANIEFVQGDLLELDAMTQLFDVIECCGVLHHLSDPIGGWRKLLARLKPGGYMKVALYSELARRSVVTARDLIADLGLDAGIASIRRFRHDVLRLPDTHPAAPVVRWRDFFSTSECRDLLFHVQERRFNLLEIEHALGELGLRFLGFEMEGRASDYLARYPRDVTSTHLRNWHEYEQDNPDTFKAMYQFWVKKPT